MTTLVTGFEPFGGALINPSELLVRALEEPANPALVAAVLPVSYRRAALELERLLELHRPELLLLFGLDQSTPHVKLETLAINRDDARVPDSDGDQRAGVPIVVGAPAAHPSTLPLDAMVATAARAGEPVVLSNDAGGYVCNHVFFTAQHLAATRYPNCRSGFVHVPMTPAPSPAFARLVALVRAWIPLLVRGSATRAG
jgi:pyroglutamyl-peptidase